MLSSGFFEKFSSMPFLVPERKSIGVPTHTTIAHTAEGIPENYSRIAGVLLKNGTLLVAESPKLSCYYWTRT
jgi:hypothetical protein